jgi:protein-disulfide isomerase
LSNRFFAILLATIAIFVGVFFITKNKSAAPGETSNAQPTSHIRGKGTTGVTVVEYGDFQCPNCGAFYPILKELEQKYGDKVAFQFRNFPLPSHQNARAAHRAAEAASLQGKFFEMHDALYENQTSWQSAPNAPAIFENYAQQLGLDVEKFKQDVASAAVNDIINADIQAGQDLNVTSTASFFIDNKKIEPRDLDSFSKIIDEAIKAKTPS